MYSMVAYAFVFGVDFEGAWAASEDNALAKTISASAIKFPSVILALTVGLRLPAIIAKEKPSDRNNKRPPSCSLYSTMMKALDLRFFKKSRIANASLEREQIQR